MADPNRPTPRQRLDRAVAAARPKVERAVAKAEPQVEKAKPQVEKAVAKAGSLLGQLRDRAQETAKSFGEGYGKNESPAGNPKPSTTGDEPHPRPKPGPR